MTKRMLIDATHAEETRVVVLDGTRLEDFDVETATKRQLKGNIYLAKVVRVEPSLQAAFVEYGGNRHGFLAFGEIHPDYYQIPVADRQRLLALQAEEALREEEEEDRAAAAGAAAEAREGRHHGSPPAREEMPAREGTVEEVSAIEFEPRPETVGESSPESEASEPDTPEEDAERPAADEDRPARSAAPLAIEADVISGPVEDRDEPAFRHETSAESIEVPAEPEPNEGATEAAEAAYADSFPSADASDAQGPASDVPGEHAEEDHAHAEPAPELPPPETVGGDGDAADEARDRRSTPRFLRNYKIQEVIRRRQILLVQVVKEERGTKGAALTTYISLAGRYGVLMPNSPRGGGISRKITSATDRRRLKEVTAELDLPKGMGLIIRTAGANRPKPEIKRDCEYLLRLWDDIREHTMRSIAPAMIYEEASLIKRAIRDVYSRDIDEILVDGEEGWKAARDFMRMLMPSHAKKVMLWRDDGMPLFAQNQVEAQLDSMLMPTVQLRSGGYLVINQTEALVAIDVNSGRSTRERNIEETALRTNLEAADEVARQLRLRDLAGLIVIDFIDMESRKHNGMVEKRLKDALKNDRARIQVGHISHFGLLEMSRQRLRPSLAETSFVMCDHCGGTGTVRSIESSALHVLRHVEEEGAKRRAAEIVVHVASPIAMYIFNHKRDLLRSIESRYAMQVRFQGDSTLIAPQLRIDRVRAQLPAEAQATVKPEMALPPPSPFALDADVDDVEDLEDGEEDADEKDSEAAATGTAAAETAEEGERKRRRRRRRRRSGRREEGEAEQQEPAAPAPQEARSDEEAGEDVAAAGGDTELPVDAAEEGAPVETPEAETEEESAARSRRRGRRGGRRRRREGEPDMLSPVAELGAEQPELPPVYQGPTPANPFGNRAYDIFDVIDQVEARAENPVARVEPAHRPAAPEPAAHEPEATAAQAEAAAPEPEPAEAEPAPVATEPEEARVAVMAAAVRESTRSERQGTPQPEFAFKEPEPPADLPPVQPANDARSEPAIKPVLIGSEENPLALKKRGWWRR